nr:hypothetical protein CFP56_48683 [Quercus suber]
MSDCRESPYRPGTPVGRSNEGRPFIRATRAAMNACAGSPSLCSEVCTKSSDSARSGLLPCASRLHYPRPRRGSSSETAREAFRASDPPVLVAARTICIGQHPHTFC